MKRGTQQTLIRRQLDTKLTPQRAMLDILRPPSKGWIRAIRKALGLTQAQLGQRAGVAPNSVVDMEQREAAETMTLGSLRRCADVLDCDLIYFLMPRQPLNKAVEQRAYAHARSVMAAVAHSMSLESQGVGPNEVEAQIRDLAEKLIRDTDSCIWDEP